MTVPTSQYKYAYFPFEYFNPLQSLILEHVEEDKNLVIAAPTSSGKTICAEMLMWYELHAVENGTLIYLSPIKALVEERLEDWAHHSDLRIQPLTSDYFGTNDTVDADLVIATYEMLAARARKNFEGSIPWIDNACCLVVDEAHFISSQGRGDHLENALMAFAARNKKCRIVCMSATLKNAEDFQEWLTKLNGKETVLIESDYRPCKLNMHYRLYEGYNPMTGRGLSYKQREYAKIDLAVDIISENPGDQYLLFVHSKAMGEELSKRLRDEFMVAVGYHSADKTKEQRKKIEDNFRNGSIRYLVATSTLAYGVNLPARRVIIVGVNRGYSGVDPTDIIQECGRSGRPKYDTEGDAYVILTKKELPTWRNAIEKGIRCDSVLIDNLGFHVLGEISSGRVRDRDTANEWLRPSLADVQGMWDERNVRNVLSFLETKDVIRNSDSSITESTGYEVRPLGKITSFFYFDPKDTVAWRDLLVRAKASGYENDEDIACLVLGTIVSQDGYLPSAYRELANDFLSDLRPKKMYVLNDYSLFRSSCLYALLNQTLTDPMLLSRIGIGHDMERIIQCIKKIETWCLQIRKPILFWETLYARIKYGVGKRQATFCAIPGVGKAYSRRLLESGVTTFRDFIRKKSVVESVLPEGSYERGVKFINGIRKTG